MLIPNIAWANISAPPEPSRGNITGQGFFKQISVLSEDLTINLSEVTKHGNAIIRAHYKIYTPVSIKNLELIFVANNLTESKYLVEIDDQFVNGYLKKFDTIPSIWFPPDSVLFQSKKIPFLYTHEGLISFVIDSLSAGEHTLSVSYEADISEWYEHDELSITRAFVYILKPYQGWKEFKNLNLNIFIPDGWDYSTNLEMEQHGSSAIHGFWEELPAHHLAITFRPKEGGVRIVSLLCVLIIGVGAAFVLILWMKIVATYRVREKKSKIIQIGNDILVAFVATVLFYIIYAYEPELKKYLLDNHLNPFYTYGNGYFIIAFPVIWFLALIPVGFVDYFLTSSIKNKLSAGVDKSAVGETANE